ncbi:hypothetical protein ACI77O_13130 [Pseudomonas tritici]|uniref:hypothetical protein n=1 Tax=Pseudomonas tritici TaxID=2745518 RepID=UPI00387AA5F9
MAFTEYSMCSFHAERQIHARRKEEYETSFKRGSALVAAMLAEGVLIDEALEPLKLSYLEKMEYVAKNSVFIKASDSHEAIQIVWAPTQVICIHRLLSKEMRAEFQCQWLGVWSEPIGSRTSDAVVDSFKQKVKSRELWRSCNGINSEIQFAVSPALQTPNYELRH